LDDGSQIFTNGIGWKPPNLHPLKIGGLEFQLDVSIIPHELISTPEFTTALLAV